ncbi:murein DD-endopeptidase MepM [Buchnera aphidicola]|uniref:murein DD-endopeptidase MepM n=1 Tax=Buchnera aphidicola TaxID=9 RepID=UPI0034648D33
MNNIIILSCLSGCDILYHNPVNQSEIKTQQIPNNTKTKKYLNEIDNIKKYFHRIEKGDKIVTLLNESKVRWNDISKLIEIDFNLNNLENGQTLSWKVDSLGKLLELKWQISNFQKNIYKNVNNYFLVSKKNLQEKLINKRILIKKNSNFFQSALQSGLNYSEINNVIQALQLQVNFKKLNTGSNFNLVFSHDLSKNKNILLGIKLNNFGKKYYFIRAFNGIFYNIDNLKKEKCLINVSFLKKYRISSHFNLQRLNPVTHRITRHLGVDLAMPQGTPVLATIDGKVTKIRFNKIAGFYIVLKNKNYYTTRYMHLKKILVKLGDNIKMGQKIALSGNTGRTTGPHLHYEVWLNNHAVDPIKLKCILSETLTKKEKKIYLEESKKILKYLQ